MSVTIISDIVRLSGMPKLVVNQQTILDFANLHMEKVLEFYDALILKTKALTR